MLDATRTLLASLEPLPHPARMRHLAEWARTAPDRAEVCADLRAGGFYERGLARFAEGDPPPTDVGDLPAADRRRLYRRLRRSRRAPEPSADALIGTVRERFGDVEAAALLPACGDRTVRALLPDLEHAVRPERLLRRHAGALVDRTRERLAAAAPEDRARIWSGAVLRCDPAAVLDLLEDFAAEDSLPGPLDAYGALAGHDVRRVAGLLTAPGRAAWLRSAGLPAGLLRRLAAMSAGDPDAPAADPLVLLATRVRDNDAVFAALLRAVAPARRAALFDRATADVDTAAWIPPAALMEVLPAALRIREATRVLALPRIREREDATLTWQAYLAWPEASAALDGALSAGDPTTRLSGYQALVGAARRSRDPRVVTEVVGRLGRLRNEQDPVRAAALTALAGVAPLLTAEAVDGLTRLTTDAVEARDASAQTTMALSRLASDVLRHHVDEPELSDWALLTIDRVSGDATVPVLRRFDRTLRRGQERMVFDRLRGWVEAGMARARYGPLFALTHALGRRAWRLPELQDLLRTAIGRPTGPLASLRGPRTLAPVAREAILLWLDDPRTRSARVAEVLAADPSAVTIGRVWETVCATRTDLLVFEAQGRFVEGRWLAGRAHRPERWLPRQRAAFVAVQRRIVDDAGYGVQRRADAVRAAARVPEHGRELVLRYVDAPEVTIAEAALGALARTDRPDLALPVLLRHAGDDRARVAMYAAARAAAHTPPSRLTGMLAEVLTGPAKVTSRKEAARLLGRYGPPEAMTTLLGLYTAPGAHRDTRAAIVSAARQRLGTEESWTILRTALDGSREERTAVLAASPYLIPERHRPRYAAFLLDGARADDPEVRRVAFARLGEWAPWLTGAHEPVVDRLTDCTTPMIIMQAAGLLRAGGDRALRDALARLAARDEPPGGPVADLPARRRIVLLTQAASMRSRFVADRTPILDTARWLAGHPAHLTAAAALLVNAGDLDNLDEVAALCAGRPGLAVTIAGHVAGRLRGLRRQPDPAELAATVTGLAARGDLAGGLFAVALARYGAGLGWPESWRDLLAGLRAHPDPDVREAALNIDMAGSPGDRRR